MKSVYQFRLETSEKFSSKQLSDLLKLGSITSIKNSLYNDVLAIKRYRERHDTISFNLFKLWFSEESENDLKKYWDFLDFNRDFVFTSSGISILQRRYFKTQEPIQFAMLRFAKTLLSNKIKTFKDGKMINYIYDLLSTGLLCISSILAEETMDACKLYVSKSLYDKNLVEQLSEIEKTIALGTGVGVSGHNLPRYGYSDVGLIKNGFVSIIRKLDSVKYFTICDRAPKIAMYLPIYNDTVLDALELTNVHVNIKSVFFALMVNDYFMNCVANDLYWYLFPGDLTFNEQSLHEVIGEEFVHRFNEFVDKKLYTEKIKARELMEQIIDCIATSTGVYILFSDTINKFQNTQHLGIVKTLNLCSEITNYADSNEPANCTLISVNLSQFNVFPDIEEKLEKFIGDCFNVDVESHCNSYKWLLDNESQETEQNETTYNAKRKIIRYSFILGFISTILLNTRIGDRKNREIGISPMGLYDLAIITNEDVTKLCSIVSESLYKGSIVGSYTYSKLYNVLCNRFIGSKFHSGQPQWHLRQYETNSDWQDVTREMKNGMANSALTCCAPTASTSLLTGCVESILVPLDIVLLRVSGNGSNKLFSLGYMTQRLNNRYFDIKDSKAFVPKDENVKKQLEVFIASAPFIDHAQSTIYNLKLERQDIFHLLCASFDGLLKNGLYYAQGISENETLNIIEKNCGSGSCAL